MVAHSMHAQCTVCATKSLDAASVLTLKACLVFVFTSCKETVCVYFFVFLL